MPTRKEKFHNTLEKNYGDSNFGLYGSEEFKKRLKNKYGSETYSNREKAKKTILEKYGVDHNFKLLNSSENSKTIWKNHKDEILEKIKETSIQRYGCESPNQCEEIKEKQKQGLINSFGNLENAYKCKYEKNKKTKLEKYGDETYHNKEQVSETLKNRHEQFEKEHNCVRYTYLIKQYGQGWFSMGLPIIYDGRFRYISNEYLPKIEQYVSKNHNLRSTSNQENELYDFLKECTEYRILKNKKNLIKDENGYYELDMYIPKLNLAFEYNGTYWHSDLIKSKYYHQIKTKLCYEKGIQLIHIYEYDWVKNKDLIKEHIRLLFEGNDCSEFNWIPLEKYNLYDLGEPEKITITCGNNEFHVYNEGKFTLKQKYE